MMDLQNTFAEDDSDLSEMLTNMTDLPASSQLLHRFRQAMTLLGLHWHWNEARLRDFRNLLEADEALKACTRALKETPPGSETETYYRRRIHRLEIERLHWAEVLSEGDRDSVSTLLAEVLKAS